MQRITRAALTALLALAGHATLAANPSSVSFDHHDWELVCDNTRTCRAAGYQEDNPEVPAVSVLLTRAAGPHQKVFGQVQFGNYGDSAPAVPKALTMKINGRSVGKVIPRKDSLTADLSEAQVGALLAALGKTSTIAWEGGETTWELSSKGAAAVLLKMDEFQDRLGTTGALARKGSRNEDAVLPALPPPVINAAPVPKGEVDKATLAKIDRKALLAELRRMTKPDDCDELAQAGDAEHPLTFAPLGGGRLLLSARCWSAAYNWGSGFWVINAAPPHAPVMATLQGSDYGDGVISLSQKGRGLGDCWASEDWTWDGRQFVHTHATWTGKCRLIAPGGAWDLPTLVTTVAPAAAARR